ncbi:putative pyranose 2-oxidase [Aspergillus flavus AF70]|nr:putative pyranose 2-oxidase [Aspergillus flavus AF70]
MSMTSGRQAFTSECRDSNTTNSFWLANSPTLTLGSTMQVVGSGPIGATYAKILADAGKDVLMVETGAQESKIPGEHKKNAINYQKDIDAFVHVIQVISSRISTFECISLTFDLLLFQGSLHYTSVPTNKAAVPTLAPVSWKANGQIFNGQNPRQDPNVNLDANGVARNVGGMSTHWTCATPRQKEKVERSDIFSGDEWDSLYKEAEKLIGTSKTVLDDSIRQKLVMEILNDEYGKRSAEPLPLAAKRNGNTAYITWSSSSTILDAMNCKKKFTLWPEHHCEKFKVEETDNGPQVTKAIIRKLATDKLITVKAKVFIACGGPILTPQLLFNSDFVPTKPRRDPITQIPLEDDEKGIAPPPDIPEYLKLPALGRYLTEQSMCFCQIVLKKQWIEAVANPKVNPYQSDGVKRKKWDKLKEGWNERVQKHMKRFNDPIPFPFDDLDPQVTLPLDYHHPWHTQIHRDAFSYGAAPPAIDKRTIVDLRFFGTVEPDWKNYVTFETDIRDAYGMPQPTFRYKLNDEDRKRSHQMMKDMEEAAGALGGYLPGSEPQFLAPGLALHVCGTTRAQKKEKECDPDPKETSCCDENSKIWGIRNLYVGGLNVIPGANGSNPTLTAMCFAIKSAKSILEGNS